MAGQGDLRETHVFDLDYWVDVCKVTKVKETERESSSVRDPEFTHDVHFEVWCAINVSQLVILWLLLPMQMPTEYPPGGSLNKWVLNFHKTKGLDEDGCWTWFCDLKCQRPTSP